MSGLASVTPIVAAPGWDKSSWTTYRVTCCDKRAGRSLTAALEAVAHRFRFVVSRSGRTVEVLYDAEHSANRSLAIQVKLFAHLTGAHEVR